MRPRRLAGTLMLVATAFPGPADAAPPPLEQGRPWVVDDRYRILTPEDWMVVEHPSYGAEFAVGSFGLEKGGDCAPTRALRFLPPDGVVFWVAEVHTPRDEDAYGPKPARFGFDDLDSATGRCVQGTGASVIKFASAGRYLRAFVTFGGRASPTTRALALSTLSSIRVNRCYTNSAWSSINVDHGAAGDTITVFGPTLRGEDGFYFPSTKIAVWWNEGVGPGDEESIKPVEAVRSFPVASLHRGELRGLCDYHLRFKVPDVPPDLYPVAVRVYDEGGFGHIGRFTFEVTRRVAAEPVQPGSEADGTALGLAGVALVLSVVALGLAVLRRRS